jgi:hypothetical protein
MEQLIKLRKKNNTLLAPKWCLQALGNPNYFKISIENDAQGEPCAIVYSPLETGL